MERELELSRGTNFEDVDTSKVAIGSTVVLSDPPLVRARNTTSSAPGTARRRKNIVSYQAGIGTALIGKAAGELVQVPTEKAIAR